MIRCFRVAAVSLVLMGVVAPAWADWRHDDPWRRHHRPPPVHAPPGAWMPGPPPPFASGRRVVYVEPPLWAIPASPVYMDVFGRTCRDYRTRGYFGYGTACLMPDGVWRVVR